MKQKILLLIPFLFCSSFLLAQKNELVADVKIDNYTSKTIINGDSTYGYKVLVGNKVLIQQSNIPGIAGTKGFKRKAYAEKTAQLVIKKLSQGIMPPTIDVKELENLKIHF